MHTVIFDGMCRHSHFFSMDLSKKVEFRILETNAKIAEVEVAIAPYLV